MIDWVADHRKHHTFTDEEGDPHSPRAGRGAGLPRNDSPGSGTRTSAGCSRPMARGPPNPFARDLLEEPTMRRINKDFPLIDAGEACSCLSCSALR